MGRIKTKLIKRKTKELIEKCGDDFSTDFEENKQKFNEVAKVKSKKIRNVIVGSVGKKMKKKTDLDDYSL